MQFKCKNSKISKPQLSSILTIGHYQVLPLQARVNLGEMALKGYLAFPKAPAILEPHH